MLLSVKEKHNTNNNLMWASESVEELHEQNEQKIRKDIVAKEPCWILINGPGTLAAEKSKTLPTIYEIWLVCSNFHSMLIV